MYESECIPDLLIVFFLPGHGDDNDVLSPSLSLFIFTCRLLLNLTVEMQRSCLDIDMCARTDILTDTDKFRGKRKYETKQKAGKRPPIVR